MSNYLWKLCIHPKSWFHRTHRQRTSSVNRHEPHKNEMESIWTFRVWSAFHSRPPHTTTPTDAFVRQSEYGWLVRRPGRGGEWKKKGFKVFCDIEFLRSIPLMDWRCCFLCTRLFTMGVSVALRIKWIPSSAEEGRNVGELDTQFDTHGDMENTQVNDDGSLTYAPSRNYPICKRVKCTLLLERSRQRSVNEEIRMQQSKQKASRWKLNGNFSLLLYTLQLKTMATKVTKS